MRVLYISYDKNDCFIERLPFFEFEVFEESRQLENIFAETVMYNIRDFNLCLIHPKDPLEEWLENFKEKIHPDKIENRLKPVILFSDDFDDLDKWIVGDIIVRLPKRLLKQNWQEIFKHFKKQKCTELKYAINDAICHNDQPPSETPQFDRHRDANRRGARILLKIAKTKEISSEFADALDERLSKIEYKDDMVRKANVPIMDPLSAEGKLFQDGRILLADDMHRHGWSTVLGGILGVDVYDMKKVGDMDDISDNVSGMYAIEKIGEEDDPRDISIFWDIIGINDREKHGFLPFDLLLSDYRIKDEDPDKPPPEVAGTHLIRSIHKIDPSLPVIVITASENYKTHRQLSRYNILGYYIKPYGRNDDRIEYKNLIEMIEYGRDNRYLRDLWKIVMWVDENRPSVRKIFQQESFLSDTGLKPTGQTDKGEYIRNIVIKALKPAIIFFFQQQCSIIPYSNPEIEDPNKLKDIDTLAWCIFRVSHASDRLIGKYKTHEKLKSQLAGDITWAQCSNVCRVLRNMVAHSMPGFLLVQDLFLQVLCIQKMVFEDTLPIETIEKLSRRFLRENDTSIPEFDELYGEFCKNLTKIMPDNMNLDFTKKHHDVLEDIFNYYKPPAPMPQDQICLHACYLSLYKSIQVQDKKAHSDWDKLVLCLISRIIKQD